MIVDVFKKPVTYVAMQWEDQGLNKETERLMDGADATLGGSFGQYLTWPAPDAETLHGPVERVWYGDWIVVSSLGEVRRLTDAQFKKEFATV